MFLYIGFFKAKWNLKMNTETACFDTVLWGTWCSAHISTIWTWQVKAVIHWTYCNEKHVYCGDQYLWPCSSYEVIAVGMYFNILWTAVSSVFTNIILNILEASQISAFIVCRFSCIVGTCTRCIILNSVTSLW